MSSLDTLTSAVTGNAQIARELTAAVDKAVIALDAGGTNNDVRLVAVTASVEANTAAVKVERDRLDAATLTAEQRLSATCAATGLPVVTSSATAEGRVGQPFHFHVTGTNQPTRYETSALPAGLRCSAVTGIISGVPTDDGSTNVGLTLTNAKGVGRGVMGILVR